MSYIDDLRERAVAEYMFETEKVDRMWSGSSRIHEDVLSRLTAVQGLRVVQASGQYEGLSDEAVRDLIYFGARLATQATLDGLRHSDIEEPNDSTFFSESINAVRDRADAMVAKSERT